MGAVDYIVKPGGTISLSIDDICEAVIAKVRAAAKARLKSSVKMTAQRPLASRRVEKNALPSMRRLTGGEGVVVIGVSTGGPSTLEMILPRLPANFPWPILVAQHMPGSFTPSFSERMNKMCALSVVEANRPMMIEPGSVYIAKGSADMVVVRRANMLMVVAKPESESVLWHPSVELLARSVLAYVDPTQVLGVMLTGMGNDGAEAFTEIKKKGGRTIAESEDSAVVFGMPGDLIKRGGASITLHAENIATQMIAWVGL